MTCEEARPLLVALIDGELPEDARASARDHLAQCHSCRAAEDEYMALLAAATERTSAREHVLNVKLAAALDELAQLRAEVRALAAEVSQLRPPAREPRPRSMGLIAAGQQSPWWESPGIV